jgi:hypothetical protein
MRADDDTAAMTPLALALAVAATTDEVSKPDYRYRLDYQSLTVTVLAEVDLRAPESERLTVLSTELAESEKAERLEAVIADLERGAAEGYWCSKLLKSVPGDARLIAQVGELATYEFDPMPTGDRNDDFLKNLSGEISINQHTGAVVRFELSAPEPFRQALVAKITDFELSTQCQPAPDGRYFAGDFRMRLQGSAAFREFKDEVSRRLTILEASAR